MVGAGALLVDAVGVGAGVVAVAVGVVGATVTGADVVGFTEALVAMCVGLGRCRHRWWYEAFVQLAGACVTFRCIWVTDGWDVVIAVARFGLSGPATKKIVETRAIAAALVT